jgi:Leucine-rich repeat (LRR) protein
VRFANFYFFEKILNFEYCIVANSRLDLKQNFYIYNRLKKMPMKKLFPLLFILCFQFISVKAQYVTIPDANFVTKLSQLFPSCMNGNQMDTTCAQIVNETNLSVDNLSINDLTGISYFDNLIYLYCDYNQLSSLPPLPPLLFRLSCSNNQLTSLPNLPLPLQVLNCANNPLSNLPNLPLSLQNLNCSNNQLTTLPSLPTTTVYLNCDSNLLTSLSIPPNIQELYCNHNLLTSLPALPFKFIYLILRSKSAN